MPTKRDLGTLSVLFSIPNEHPCPFFLQGSSPAPPMILPPIVGYGNQDSTVFTLSASSKGIHFN